MTRDKLLLLRYIDGELSPDETAAFRIRLSRSPELRRQLAEIQNVGALLRGWAHETERRAGPLLDPTLERIQRATRKRRRAAGAAAVALAAATLALAPAGQPFVSRAPLSIKAVTRAQPAAAIERLEAPHRQAQVFLVGSSSTPVVWLADELDEGTPDQRDPG